MLPKLHTFRLFLTEAAAIFALLISVSTLMADFILKSRYALHNPAMALSLTLIGLSLFSICFLGCAMSDNHHWRMFMGIIFVLWGVGMLLPDNFYYLEFNDIVTVLFVIDIFLIIYDNSTIILKGSKTCKIEKPYPK